MINKDILQFKISVPNPKIMHITNALGNTHNYPISLLIVSDLLSVLWKITASTEFHEKVNAGLISKACIYLC